MTGNSSMKTPFWKYFRLSLVVTYFRMYHTVCTSYVYHMFYWVQDQLLNISRFLPNVDKFPYPRRKLNVSWWPVSTSDDVIFPPDDSGGLYSRNFRCFRKKYLMLSKTSHRIHWFPWNASSSLREHLNLNFVSCSSLIGVCWNSSKLETTCK